MAFRLVRITAIVVVLAAACATCRALPIVTMPTANMQPPMSVALDFYSLELRPSNPYAPSRMTIVAGYIGLAKRLELDVVQVRAKAMPPDTTVTLQYLAVAESRLLPAVAIGVEDAGLELGDRSLYAVMSKVVTPMTERGPTFPLVQLTLGYGTSPRSSAFGGVAIGLHPLVGVVAQNDGLQSTYSISLTVPKTALTVRFGTLGHARWWGAEYVVSF